MLLSHWKCLVVSFLLLFCIGCSSNIDEFQFINVSQKDIYVKGINGFNPSPPVGYLSHGHSASSLFMGSKIIAECEIVWGFQKNQDGSLPTKYYSSPCNLIELEKVPSKVIKFTFDEGFNWSTSSLLN